MSAAALAHATWLDDRRRGIGGSDVAAILGLSKFQTPADVWRSKMGIAPDVPETPAMRRGRLLEPAVATWYAEETGAEVADPPAKIIEGPEPWMLASLDRVVHHPDDVWAILECKTANFEGTIPGLRWGPSGSQEIPEYYLLQVIWYLACAARAGITRADVAVGLVGTRDDAHRFRMYTFHRDPEAEAGIVDACREWWREYVVAGVEPPPMSANDVFLRHPHVRAAFRPATERAAALAEELREVRRHKSLVLDREADLETQIKAEIGDAEGMFGPFGRIRWAEIKGRTTVDGAALKKAHPNLYQQFSKAGAPIRRFDVEFNGEE
jgi:putative phage-type endonuclease